MATAIPFLIVGGFLVVLGFVLLGPVGWRARTAFALGFEPWAATSITPLPAGGYLVEEHFSPQRGTWTRLSVVDARWRVTHQRLYSDSHRVRLASPHGFWSEEAGEVRRLSLPSFSMGPSLMEYATQAVGAPVARARLDGPVVWVQTEDGREQRLDVADAAVAQLMRSTAVLATQVRVAGESWSTTPSDGQTQVRGPGTTETFVAPMMLTEPGGEPLARGGGGVLVSHKPNVSGSRSLLSRLNAAGAETYDLAEQLGASSTARMEPIWAHGADARVTLGYDVRDGRDSRTVFIRMGETAPPEVLLVLDRSNH